ncbi:MAG TPA: hypothetical protein VF145_10065 [Chitinophagaceae bacterium]
MKKHMFFKILLLLLVTGISEVQAQGFSFSVGCEKFNLKRPRYDCERGFGLCIINCGINIRLSIVLFTNWEDVPEENKVAFTPDKENGTVTVRFLQDVSNEPDYDGTLEIDESEMRDYLWRFTDEDAEKLGFRSIQFLPGRYEIQPEEGNYGMVVIKVRFDE